MSTQSFEEFLQDIRNTNTISVLADENGMCVSIMTENVQYYAEWIKGEGGDISLFRAMDDNRLIGALLPIRNWSGIFITAMVPKLQPGTALEVLKTVRT